MTYQGTIESVQNSGIVVNGGYLFLPGPHEGEKRDGCPCLGCTPLSAYRVGDDVHYSIKGGHLVWLKILA